MEATTFFSGSNRRVVLSGSTLLIGKNKTRKIKIPLTMPLSSESVVGMPDWLSEAFQAVSQCATDLTPEVEQIADVTITLHNPTKEAGGALFDTEDAKIPSGELKKFLVCRTGDGENPEVSLKFTCYAAFARDLWRWLGEMGGETVTAKFPSAKPVVESVQPDTPPLYDDPEMELERQEAVKPEHDAEFAGDDVPEPPTVADEFGPEYEQQVRESLGAPEPLSDKPRLVDARRKRTPRKKKMVN